MRACAPPVHELYLSMLTATEGDTTETETDPETELDEAYAPPHVASGVQTLMQHDLMNQYFHKDVIVLCNVDLLRCAARFVPHARYSPVPARFPCAAGLAA